MKYLALGDSMSIDTYTGIEGGGAANQFAGLIGAEEVQDLTHDGFTTEAILRSVDEVRIRPDVITLTACGNDLMLAPSCLEYMDEEALSLAVREPLERLEMIAERLHTFQCPVIMNTVYDPTDGDDLLLLMLGFSPQFRTVYERVNSGIRDIAKKHKFILSDLQGIFVGHGIKSSESWLTMQIEPNLAGATSIALNWYNCLRAPFVA